MVRAPSFLYGFLGSIVVLLIFPVDLPARVTGMTASDTQWVFKDTLGCITGAGCGASHQTFTISPNPGVCASPSYGNAGTTPCRPAYSGTIVVHSPSLSFQDAGVLWLNVVVKNITVNDFYRWPGVQGP
jgi:hypothetical protein